MDWLAVIIVGGIIGWLASIMMKTDAQQGILLNVIIGIVGSLLGRWLFVDVLGIGSAAAAGEFNLAGLLFGILGAVILIAILKALRIFA
jgi:uncharacterized membrane protein YeaQ/YmgE (transglycosylase-associated protein family)